MVAAGLQFADTAASGTLVAAIGVAALAGLVSFLSPCVLPLGPAYVSSVTGMSGAELEAATGSGRRWRVATGVALFVLGFTLVFASFGAAPANSALPKPASPATASGSSPTRNGNRAKNTK